MNRKRIAISAALLLMGALSVPPELLAQERPASKQTTGSLAVGMDLGLQAGTADDETAFAFAMRGDYYLDQHLSLGPLLQFGFTGDLTQVGLSAQAKYTFDLPRIPELKPHLQGGLGFIHVDIDCGQPCDDSDTGFLVPFGGGFELELSKNLFVGTTLLLNFNDADVTVQRAGGNLFMSWFFGLRIMLN
jgi:hypothetical protein